MLYDLIAIPHPPHGRTKELGEQVWDSTETCGVGDTPNTLAETAVDYGGDDSGITINITRHPRRPRVPS